MIERRERWERALACTRAQLVLELCASVAFLACGVALRPRPSSALIALVGLAAGFIAHSCNRLVLAQPPLVRRIDWDSEPRSPSPPRNFSAGLLVAVLILLALAAVYTETDGAATSLLAFFGGMFLAYTLVTAAQRSFLERDFARRLSAL